MTALYKEAMVASRRIVLVTHPRRQEAQEVAEDVTSRLEDAGVHVQQIHHSGMDSSAAAITAADPIELVVVLGGDGTILRGAEFGRDTGAPVLGVNLGHVGFLAEAERDDLSSIVSHIVDRSYTVEERMAIEVTATLDGEELFSSWALNEVSVEKAARERMIELAVEIDGHPISTWGCDGVVMATPTGSTAYAFSAGGPVVWPELEALLMVPLSAHALFARPLVVAPTRQLAVELVPGTDGRAVLWCDGSRTFELPAASRIVVARSDRPVRLARLSRSSFADRLVAKFDLPTQGWRGAARSRLTDTDGA